MFQTVTNKVVVDIMYRGIQMKLRIDRVNSGNYTYMLTFNGYKNHFIHDNTFTDYSHLTVTNFLSKHKVNIDTKIDIILTPKNG